MTKTEQSPGGSASPEAERRVWDYLPSLSKARLKELIEQAIVDAYGEKNKWAVFSP